MIIIDLSKTHPSLNWGNRKETTDWRVENMVSRILNQHQKNVLQIDGRKIKKHVFSFVQSIFSI